MNAPLAETELVAVAAQPAAVVWNTVTFAGMRQAQQEAQALLHEAFHGREAARGPRLTVWRPPRDGIMDYAPGYLLIGDFTAKERVAPFELPEGKAARRTLRGGYEGLPGAWGQLFADCNAQGWTPAGLNWEIYGEGADGQPETVLTAFLVGSDG